MYQGLILSSNKGIRMLLAEVDNLCVTQLIQSQTLSTNASSSLVNGTGSSSRAIGKFQCIIFIRRPTFAADFLATFALSLPLGLHVLSTLPLGVDVYLRSDSSRAAFPRFVMI